MRTLKNIAIATALTVCAATGTARAIPNAPSSANGFASDIVKAYEHCDPAAAANSTQNSFFPRPACDPALAMEPTCGFGPGGQGKVKMKVENSAGDIKYRVKMRGLSAGCSGQTLDFIIKYQQTNDDCLGGASCTSVDTELLGGSCVVTPTGRCTIVSTLNTDTTTSLGGPAFAAGDETSLAVDGCGLLHNGNLAFRCGMLIR